MTLTSKPVALFVALVLLAGGAAVAWFVLPREPALPPPPVEDESVAPDPAPPDPRLTANSPFRNIRPDVGYTGDARCAECHAQIAGSYHAHPMGRSAEYTPAAPVLEKYGAPPVKVGPYTLRAERDAKGVVTHVASASDATGKPLPDYAVRADVVIGSGTRGRSYLSIERGSAWQTALSWFGGAQEKWDVSPGFDLGTGGRRYVVPTCLFCHVDSVRPVAGATNRYEEPLFPVQASIGCERCHGPGELHCRERAKSPAVAKPDHSIVNPKHLSPALQTAVCEQCHLQGEERIERRGRGAFEFRPGLHFDEFVSAFVRHPDAADLARSVGQHEQMAHSRCATGGKLVCTSCHDPHAKPAPAAREAHYRAKCNACHEHKPCTARPELRADRGDSCITCHMPRGDSSNIAHTSVTDHRVIRRPAPRPAPRALSPETAPLVAYRPAALPEPDLARGLGIALGRAAVRIPPGPVRHTVARHAEAHLTRALEALRGDAGLWSGLSAARSARDDAPGALVAAERAARLAPASEGAHTDLAAAALSAGRYDRAEAAATVLIGMNPRAVEPLLTRSAARAASGDWPGSLADAKAALAIHPLHPRARLRLAVALHRTGDPSAGAAEAATAAALATSDRQRDALREQFAAETR